MDKKKLARLLVSPAALTMVFGALVSNAATLEPQLGTVVGTETDQNLKDTNNNNNNNNNDAMATAMKPGLLKALDAELRLS
jgi:hypothetical protein